MEMRHFSDDALLLAASSAVREDTHFAFSISKKSPQAYSDFLDRAKNYVNSEATTRRSPGPQRPPEETLKGTVERR